MDRNSAVRGVDLHTDRRLLQVDWEDGNNDLYPFLWLRDSCQCSECFDAKSHTRSTHFYDLDIDSSPTKAEVGDHVVRVTWEGGHVSPYASQWLRERSFNTEAKQLRDRLHARPVITWNAQQMKDPPRAKFDHIISDNRALYDWLVTLEETGLIILTDAPKAPGAIRQLAEHISYLRRTHYGETSLIRAKANPSSLAYATTRLPLHTDLQYVEDIPGMQMLHCITQTRSEGGDNELVDGFHVAEVLRRTDPEAFKLLTEVELDFYDIGMECGRDFHTVARHPTIELGMDQQVKQIHYSNHIRDSGMPVSLDQVDPVIKALHKFCRLCYDPENLITYKMRDGEMLCFNNQRVLHGRTGYHLAADGQRVLEVGYISWDDIHCQRRVLKDKFGVPLCEY